jgi:hypothetical protein
MGASAAWNRSAICCFCEASMGDDSMKTAGKNLEPGLDR